MRSFVNVTYTCKTGRIWISDSGLEERVGVGDKIGLGDCLIVIGDESSESVERALVCVYSFRAVRKAHLAGKGSRQKKVRAQIVPFLTGGRTERLGGSGEEREGGREKRPNQSKNLKEKKEPGGGNPSPTTLFLSRFQIRINRVRRQQPLVRMNRKTDSSMSMAKAMRMAQSMSSRIT